MSANRRDQPALAHRSFANIGPGHGVVCAQTPQMFITLALLGALSAPTNDAEVSQLVWERSVDLQGARVKIAQAQADAAKARLLPNPTLDVSYNTIPLGEHNPAGEPF